MRKESLQLSPQQRIPRVGEEDPGTLTSKMGN